MSQCQSKIRPFPMMPIIECEKDAHDDADHAGVLRDYAYPGSRTEVHWLDSDRRSFTGAWIECPVLPCTLPANHRGEHEPHKETTP